MKLTALIPYPNRKWGAEFDNKKEVMFSEDLLVLPEGEYNLDEHGFTVHFINPETFEISFVYREFGTGKIKVHEIDIYDELIELMEEKENEGLY